MKLSTYVAVETEGTARNLERYFKSGLGKAVAMKRFLNRQFLPPEALAQGGHPGYD